MTKQIERAYRRNRRTSWLLVAALVVIAAIAIPLASGAPSKYYNLAHTSASDGSICFGQSEAVVLRLTNRTNPQTLGSANITLPSIVTATANSASATTGSVSQSGNTISLRNLNLAPKTGSVDVTVTVSGTTTGTNKAITAIVKQANDFNDSGGDANVFLLQGASPTLSVVDCVGTIEGRIWRDSNESTTQDGTEAGQAGWDVYLYKNGSSPAFATVETNGNGDYIFTGVPLNHDYVVCEDDPSNGSWAQSTPTTEPPKCSGAGHEDAGHSFNFTASVTGKNFGNVNTVGIDCPENGGGSLQFTTSTADSSYTVKVAGGSCGKDAEFVFEAYATGATERVANLHPVDPGATGAIHVLEKMEWVFTGSGQPDPANRSLKYDDEAPYNPVPMPYCLKDPRSGPFDLDSTQLNGVLPEGHTSCLITTIETADSVSGGTREDIAYTSVDGYRAFP